MHTYIYLIARFNYEVKIINTYSFFSDLLNHFDIFSSEILCNEYKHLTSYDWLKGSMPKQVCSEENYEETFKNDILIYSAIIYHG